MRYQITKKYIVYTSECTHFGMHGKCLHPDRKIEICTTTDHSEPPEYCPLPNDCTRREECEDIDLTKN